MNDVWVVLATGTALGAVYAAVGAAVSAVAVSTRTLHLAIGPIMATATVVGLSVTTVVAGPGGAVGGLAAAAAVGALLSLPIEPLITGRTEEPFTALLALAVVAAVVAAFAGRVLGAVTVRPDPLFGIEGFAIGASTLPAGTVDTVVVAVPVALVVAYVVAQRRWGRRLRMVGSSPEASALAGIAAPRVRTQAFVVSGVVAGALGFVVAPLAFTSVAGGLGLTVRALAVAALAGQRPARSLAIGLLLGLAEATGQLASPSVGGDVAVAMVVIVTLVVGGDRSDRSWGRAW